MYGPGLAPELGYPARKVESMSTKPEVAIIGAAILDVIVPGADARVFELGSFPAKGISLQTGGDAFNEAAVLAKLGRGARLIGRIGRDLGGDLILSRCRELGINTGFLNRADIDTGLNIVLVDGKGERHFITNPEGSLRRIEPGDVFAAIESPDCSSLKIISFASVFAYPLLMPCLADIFRAIKARGPLLCVDVTSRKNNETIDDIAPALRYADYVFPNLREAQLLCGREDPDDIAGMFLDRGVGCAVIKLGARGCLVKSDGLRAPVPAVPGIRAIDTTGAGDNFAAGFIDALLDGEGPIQCASRANAAASLCVERIGATSGPRDRAEVLRRAAQISIPSL